MQASRIGAATGVFEQQGIVESGAIFSGEPKVFGNSHTQNTATDGIAHGLAFGQIQGDRERRDHV